MAVTIHWTGLLDWNTGLDYWTDIFSFLGTFLCFSLHSNIGQLFKYKLLWTNNLQP